MIKGDEVRPLVINGIIKFPKIILGRVIKDDTTDNKQKYVQVISYNNSKFFDKGYKAYIFEDSIINNDIKSYLDNNKITYLLKTNYVNTLCNNDVVGINGESGIINIYYRDNSYDNAIALTNQCNSNCIFCPESISFRKKHNTLTIERIRELIDYIPSDTKYLCITGGEPTLLKDELFDVLKMCKNKFENTKFIMLSNGRMFYYKDYAIKYVKSRPLGTIIAIAIHGDNEYLHDYCTRSKGSFKQSYTGIENLYNLGENIEIRIVVNKLNYQVLPNIAKLIIDNFPKILRVNFMGLEMLGNAAINKDKVWIDFNKVENYINTAVLMLIKNGITTNLYNFPLCHLNPNLWQIAIRSISDYKVRYPKECLNCNVKNLCGGFFESTYKLGKICVKPI